MTFHLTPRSTRIGIIGSGTMGSGIASLALMAGFTVTLYDLEPQALERARQSIAEYLLRKKRALDQENLGLADSLESLRGCQVVIEAAPEDLALKQELFAALDELCPPPAILATNTSTLPVTAIASASRWPERVAGMHFFNPAPVLPLVEVVQGAQTSQDTLEALLRLAESFGKSPVLAGDTPGFIVNRVARPFYGEALRLLGESAASHEQIDRIVRVAGGFRMGPFQLMDLIGIDVNYAATRSMYEQTFHEPRYRPHPIQARLVQQNALGRKSGRGFYQYGEGKPGPDPEPPRPQACEGPVALSAGSWAPGLETILKEAGCQIVKAVGTIASLDDPVAVLVVTGRQEGLRDIIRQVERRIHGEAPLLCQCADACLAEIAAWVERPERLVGFDGLFFSNGPIATLVASPGLSDEARQAAEGFVNSLGRLAEWVADTPGLVLPRIVSMLVNEAAFAAGEGVAPAETIDRAMQLGANYPQGPLEWARKLGYRRLVAVLDHLRAEYGEERYRVAPLLRKWARTEV